jgi:VIT1/CCC1 family predicted Fe2+/Mn2+ transporter
VKKGLSGLTDEQKKKLLDTIKKIHANKKIKVMGFVMLAEKSSDNRIKRLLLQVKNEEEEVIRFWSDKIRDLGEEEKAQPLFQNLQIKMLMNVLGTKGFFEWVLEEEEQVIQDLAFQAERFEERTLSETWSRFAYEERIQQERIKNQVLGMDTWEIIGTSGARNVSTIYSGFYSGFISTLAFVTGVIGALQDVNFLIVSSLASLFAGSVSTIAGTYQSLQSEMEVLIRERRKKEIDGLKSQDEESKLIEFYLSEGYTKDEARAMVNRIKTKEALIQENVLEELGLGPQEFGNPLKTALTGGLCFAVSALVPILPFTLRFLKLSHAIIISIISTLIGLFCIGALKTIYSRKDWFRSGLEVMLFGALASTVTYMIGKVISLFI